jgi:hypothetical protein
VAVGCRTPALLSIWVQWCNLRAAPTRPSFTASRQRLRLGQSLRLRPENPAVRSSRNAFPEKADTAWRLGRGGEPFAPRWPAVPAGHQSRGIAGFSAAASLMQDRQGRGRSRLSERCVVSRLRARGTHRRNAMPLRTAFCWTAAGVRPSVFATSVIAARSLAKRFSVRRSVVVHK